MYSITTSSSESRSSPTALPTSSWVKTKRWTGVASACSSQTYQSLPLGRSAALVIEESYFNSSYLSSRLMSAHFQRPSDGSSKRSQVGTTLLSRLPGDPQTPRRAPRRTNGAFVSCWPWPVPPPHGLRTIGGHVVPVAGASTIRQQTPGSAPDARRSPWGLARRYLGSPSCGPLSRTLPVGREGPRAAGGAKPPHAPGHGGGTTGNGGGRGRAGRRLLIVPALWCGDSQGISPVGTRHRRKSPGPQPYQNTVLIK